MANIGKTLFKFRYLLIIFAVLIILIAVLVLKNKGDLSQSTLSNKEVSAPVESFARSSLHYYSSSDDQNFFYGFDSGNKKLVQFKRSDFKQNGRQISFETVEQVYSNSAYENVIIKGSRPKEEFPRFYFCDFELGSCQSSALPIGALSLLPASNKAIAQIINEEKATFELVDLKSEEFKELASTDSFEYKLEFIDDKTGMFFAEPTEPGINNPISTISLENGQIKTVLREASSYRLSPQRKYLIFSKEAKDKTLVYLYDIAKSRETILETNSIHQAFFSQDESKIYIVEILPDEQKAKLLFYSMGNVSAEPTLIKEYAFGKDDELTDVIWLRGSEYLLLTKDGLEMRIAL
ncbi:MAG: hypothetical protein OEV37_00175 [Candidatus Berkelbacteria bacterium]|nr:hypothetical protein [Candidatus Berkelbacteria bacterium]